MEIYIIRHAIATAREGKKYRNDDRPLTKEGIGKMKQAAQGIRRIVREVDVIISSPLIRASDTARIVAKALKHKHKIVVCRELLPDASTDAVLQYLTKFKETARVMIVGHEPLLGSIASALLGSTTSIVELKKGAFCGISIAKLPASTAGTLLWHLSPKQLRMLA